MSWLSWPSLEHSHSRRCVHHFSPGQVLLSVAEASIFSVCTGLEVTLSIFSGYSLVRLIFPCRGWENTPSLNSSSAVPLSFEGPF